MSYIDPRLFYIDRKAVNRRPFRKRHPILHWIVERLFLAVQLLALGYFIFLIIYFIFKSWPFSL